MGTNYYLRPTSQRKCEHCGTDLTPPTLHIGKSSAGWAFSLHVTPEEGINTYVDWRVRFSLPGVKIEDEYGREILTEDMEQRIAERKGPCKRHPVDGRRCVLQGEGTYDYIVGEFF